MLLWTGGLTCMQCQVCKQAVWMAMSREGANRCAYWSCCTDTTIPLHWWLTCSTVQEAIYCGRYSSRTLYGKVWVLRSDCFSWRMEYVLVTLTHLSIQCAGTNGCTILYRLCSPGSPWRIFRIPCTSLSSHKSPSWHHSINKSIRERRQAVLQCFHRTLQAMCSAYRQHSSCWGSSIQCGRYVLGDMRTQRVCRVIE